MCQLLFYKIAINQFLQKFKGIIGGIEFDREDVYEAACQLINDMELSDALDGVSSDIAGSFVSAVRDMFEIAESCGSDVYDFLTVLQGEIECRKNTLAEEIASFKWRGRKVSGTMEFKKINEIYRSLLLD